MYQNQRLNAQFFLSLFPFLVFFLSLSRFLFPFHFFCNPFSIQTPAPIFFRSFEINFPTKFHARKNSNNNLIGQHNQRRQEDRTLRKSDAKKIRRLFVKRGEDNSKEGKLTKGGSRQKRGRKIISTGDSQRLTLLSTSVLPGVSVNLIHCCCCYLIDQSSVWFVWLRSEWLDAQMTLTLIRRQLASVNSFQS